MTLSAFGRLRERLASLDGGQVRFQALFFANFAAFSGFAVFRNVYLEEMGLSGSAMGQIGFLMTATGVAAQPLWGVVTDYLRAERPVLVLGAVVSGLSLLAYPVAERLAAPFALLAAGTAVYSAFRAPILPVANGLVLSRGYDYGNVRALGSIAFGIGSLGFGFLVAALGVSSVVYFYAFGMAVLVLVVLSIPGSSDSPKQAGDSGTDGTDDAELSRAARALVTNYDFLVVLAVGFLVGLSTRGGSAFFSVYMRAVEARVVAGPWTLTPDALTGIAWALKTAFEALAFVYAVRLSWSYRSFLVVGGAAVTLPNLVYGLTARPWAVVAVQAVGGIGYGLYYVASVELVHVVASDRVTATAQTVFTGLGFGLGGAAGQVVAGELYDAFGIQRMYVVVAVLGFAGALVGLFVRQSGTLGSTDAAT